MNTIDSTKLIELAKADYKMLKEKGKEGEKVLHYNGYLDGFAMGWNEGKKEEAEAMAEKLRAVLKGADVIEMLSEDEIEAKAYDISADWLEQEYMQVAYDAALKMADWLRTKIVK